MEWLESKQLKIAPPKRTKNAEALYRLLQCVDVHRL